MSLLSRAAWIAALLFLTTSAQAATCLTSNAFREPQATIDACSHEIAQVKLPNTQQAALFERRGNANYWAGEFNQAIDDFNKALELDKSLNESRIQRGWAYTRVGLMDRAETDFSNALAENPRSARAVFAIGYMYGQRGDTEKERQAYEQAASLDPTYYLARYNLAKNCECDEANLLEALEIIDSLLAEGETKLNKTESWTTGYFQTKDFYDDVLWRRIDLLVKLNRNAEARDHTMELLKKYPENPALIIKVSESYGGPGADYEKQLHWNSKVYDPCMSKPIDEFCFDVAQQRMQTLTILRRSTELKETAEKLLQADLNDWYRAVPRFYLGLAKKASNDVVGAKEDLLWAGGHNEFYQQAILTQLEQSGYYSGQITAPWSLEAENALEACLIDADCMK